MGLIIAWAKIRQGNKHIISFREEQKCGYWKDNAPTNPTWKVQMWHYRDRSCVEPSSLLSYLQTKNL